MERVLMTGSTGGIGIALARELLSRGKYVAAVVRPDSRRAARLPAGVDTIACELGALPELAKDLPGPFDTVYHLGWDHSRAHSDVDAQLPNVAYTLKAVETAARLGCSCFVGAGSQAEYGRVEGVITESTPCFPETAYGMAKLCAGQMGRLLCEQRKLRFVWPRIFSVYGPGDAESTMIISVIRQLLAGEVPALTRGEQMWDFLWSADCARALCLLGENPACEGIYCVASGAARPLRTFVEELRDCVAPESRLDFGARPYAPRQVMNLRVDIGRLARDAGFCPETPFADGVRQIVRWCREHPKESDPRE